jgi:MFS family permease
MAGLLSVSESYASLIAPFILGGAGMALVFAPSANAVLTSVRTDQAGQASGATNAIRELGGVLGVSVLATVFTARGGYSSPQAFVNGLTPALWVGTAVLAVGALVALVLPFSTRADAEAQALAESPAGAESAGDVTGVRHGDPAPQPTAIPA